MVQVSFDLYDIFLKNFLDNNRLNYNYNCLVFVYVLLIFFILKMLYFILIFCGVNCKQVSF